MTEKQEKITIAIEVIYTIIWLVALIATGLIGGAGIELTLIALDAIAIIYGAWLWFYSSSTGNLMFVTLFVIMIGNVSSAIVIN